MRRIFHPTNPWFQVIKNFFNIDSIARFIKANMLRMVYFHNKKLILETEGQNYGAAAKLRLNYSFYMRFLIFHFWKWYVNACKILMEDFSVAWAKKLGRPGMWNSIEMTPMSNNLLELRSLPFRGSFKVTLLWTNFNLCFYINFFESPFRLIVIIMRNRMSEANEWHHN